MAERADLEIEQGAEFYRTMTIMDINRIPLNLTNYTPQCQLRNSPGSSSSKEVHCEIIDALTGRLSISLSHTETESLDCIQGYFYDIELTSPENKRYRVLQGRVDISPNITL